ncbi:MAG: NUDIX hydrolase [Deltaproteobacteria bacterium]|nr:NUDIX hydrolase [Deltaproteobacteria bacterium]
MKESFTCPECGKGLFRYKNPFPTVDIIIKVKGGIVLIQRKNPPHGWAIPGGFVDYGESLETAAVREAKEETSLDVRLVAQLGAYSDPERDPRHHTISVVFIAEADGVPVAADDALSVKIFTAETLPETMAFDHKRICMDYFSFMDQQEKSCLSKQL